MATAEDSTSVMCMVEQDLKLLAASRSSTLNIHLLNFIQAIGLEDSSPELQVLRKKLGLREILADINKLESLYLKKVQEISKFLEEIEADRAQNQEYIETIYSQVFLKELNKCKVNEVRNVLSRQISPPNIHIARELDTVIQKYECLKKTTNKEKEKFINAKNPSLFLQLNRIAKDADDKVLAIWVQVKKFETLADCKWAYLQMKKAQVQQELSEMPMPNI